MLSPASGTYERDGTVDEVFTQRASERPQALAIVADQRSLTYADVERDANRVANHLFRLGVQPGASVGVGFERSVDLPAALLGILKAGAAYVPLDPSYPGDRLTFMIEDAAVAFVVTDERRARFPETPAGRIDISAALAAPVERRPALSCGPRSLAYITYTSGSTGRPKGVAIEHRGILRLVRGTDYMAIGTSDAFLHFAPLAFDASTFEIWAPLLNGARLVVPRPGLFAMDELAETIDRFGVTKMFLTTSLFQRLVDAPFARPKSLRHLLTGGEVASPSHATRFLRSLPGCRLSAVYGPTENTTFSTWCDISSTEAIGASVPIGKPIANSTAFVVDGELRPLPVGVTGELCVGGDGVARGYVNLPELTTERFVHDPFSADPAARLYRTGDRARWRSDGMLEFVGRDDNQVKVRGFRIELGEIEFALRTHQTVHDAAVVVTDRNGEKDVVAYVVPSPGVRADERDLCAHLSLTLPPYMVPHHIVMRSELPLNPSGKVDRVALARSLAPAPQVRPASVASRLVRDSSAVSLERTIGDIWRELLGCERELDENFFDAGGDSLRLLSVHARLRERLNVDVSVTDLFEQSTIRKLAAFVARSHAQS